MEKGGRKTEYLRECCWGLRCQETRVTDDDVFSLQL